MRVRLTQLVCTLVVSWIGIAAPSICFSQSTSQQAATTTSATKANETRPLANRSDYLLGSGDVIRFSVFQNADLSVETRIGESGTITYPLIGSVKIGGLTSAQAEALVAKRLKDGNFLQNPSVTSVVTQFRSQQVSILGNVNRPGRYPLETTGTKLSEVLAQAGGVSPNGSDTVIINSERNGQRAKIEIDVAAMFLSGDFTSDIALQAGDIVYVHRISQFYVHGQIQRPGAYPIERAMTIGQAIARSGGLTLRGKEKGLRITRSYSNAPAKTFEPKLDDLIQPDDLIFVPESVF
jgi:polysaccharide biosynthesis/export protein